MGTIILGSSQNQKGITVNPKTVFFNSNYVKKIMHSSDTVWEHKLWLYNKGVMNNVSTALRSNFGNLGYSIGTVVYNANNITMSASRDSSGGAPNGIAGVLTTSKIDLSYFDKIVINTLGTYSSSVDVLVTVCDSNSNILSTYEKRFETRSSGTVEFDISDVTGEKYVSIIAYARELGSSITSQIQEWYLK